MALFARSDMLAVAIPVESGGCGSTHSRPVIDGAPVKIWKMACPRCETTLREDPRWGQHQLKIPLTPDEEDLAEEMEKSGQTIMHQVAEGMSKQAISNLQATQAEEIDRSEAKAASAAASERVTELERQLAEMRQLIDSARKTGVPELAVTTSELDKRAVTGSAEAKQETSARVLATRAACASCGGPLRSPGARGPTPKGTCMPCRQAGRRSVA